MDDLSYLSQVVASSNPPSSTTSGPAASANSQAPADSRGTSAASSTKQLQSIIDALQASSSALSNGNGDGEGELDEASVAALLEKLEQADSASDEMEKRLDALLADLDGMLDTLASQNPHAGEPTNATVTPSVGHGSNGAPTDQS